MSLAAMQKQPVYWFDSQGLLCDRLTLSKLLTVSTNDVATGTENNSSSCSALQDQSTLIGVVLQVDGEPSKEPDVSVFVAQPSRAFTMSLSNIFVQLAAQIYEQEKTAAKAILDNPALPVSLPIVFYAKAPLKYDEMLTGVALKKYSTENYYLIEILIHKSDAKANSLKMLQRLLTFCLATAAHAEKSMSSFISESDVKSLNLYSFAWLCSVLKTLLFHYYAEQMETIFVQNLDHFYKICSQGKDYTMFVMFISSIAVRRTSPMKQVLQFVCNKQMYAHLKKFCDDFTNQLESPAAAAAADNKKFSTKMFRKTATIITSLLEQHCHLTDDSQQSLTTSIHSKHKRALKLITLVDVFIAWFEKLVKTTSAAQRRQHSRVEVHFDQLVCDIECNSDDPKHYKRYCCKRQCDQRVAYYSLSDLNEWLRYMVLLQLDERNIHKETFFLLYVAPQIVEFGPPPRLTFTTDGGIDLLTFFLLESEFIRASLHQARPALQEMRQGMTKSLQLNRFVSKKAFYLTKNLIEIAATKYKLKTIQGITLK